MGGGNRPIKIATFITFIALWLGFVCACSWRVMRYELMSEAEEWFVISGSCFLLLVNAGIPLTMMMSHRHQHGMSRAKCSAEKKTDQGSYVENEKQDGAAVQIGACLKRGVS